MAPPAISNVGTAFSGRADSGLGVVSYTHAGGGLLVIWCSHYSDSNVGMTWNGTAMTLLTSHINGSYVTNKIRVFYLASAAAGTYNVAATNFNSTYEYGSIIPMAVSGTDWAISSVLTSAAGYTRINSFNVTGDADDLFIGIFSARRNGDYGQGHSPVAPNTTVKAIAAPGGGYGGTHIITQRAGAASGTVNVTETGTWDTGGDSGCSMAFALNGAAAAPTGGLPTYYHS